MAEDQMRQLWTKARDAAHRGNGREYRETMDRFHLTQAMARQAEADRQGGR